MKEIRWGILGASKIAFEQVIPAMLKSKNTKLLAIASRDIDKAKLFSQKYSIQRVYNNYEQLISDPEIDAIYIPLPNHLHVPYSIQCLNAGKHVLCEKPISIKAKEVLDLIEIQKKNRRIFSEAYMVRFHPQWIKTKELIDNGAIGKLTGIQGMFNYYNVDPKNIRNDASIGGGGLLDIGVYPIVTSRYVLGCEPEKVIALVDYDKKFKTDILATAILKFGSVQMSFICSTQSHLMQHMRFIGSEGRLEIPVPFNPVADEKSEIFLWKNVHHPSKEPDRIDVKKADQYTIQIEEMNTCILNDRPFPFDLNDSYKNMKIIDSIFKSSQTQSWEVI